MKAFTEHEELFGFSASEANKVCFGKKLGWQSLKDKFCEDDKEIYGEVYHESLFCKQPYETSVQYCHSEETPHFDKFYQRTIVFNNTTNDSYDYACRGEVINIGNQIARLNYYFKRILTFTPFYKQGNP